MDSRLAQRQVIGADSDWQPKVWGVTRALCRSKHYSKHELKVKAGGYCSWHFHTQRANDFIVLSGELIVATLFGPYEVIETLRAGDSLVVPSMVVHQFRCESDAVLFEEYFADRGGEVHDSDITRLMEGGMLGREGDVSSFGELLPALFAQYDRG